MESDLHYENHKTSSYFQKKVKPEETAYIMEEQGTMSQHSVHSQSPVTHLCFISKSHPSYLASCILFSTKPEHFRTPSLQQNLPTYPNQHTFHSSAFCHPHQNRQSKSWLLSHISSAVATDSKSWKYTDTQFRACRHNNLPTDIT